MPHVATLAHAVQPPTLVSTTPKVRVLVADDDLDVCEATYAALIAAGHQAHRCASGNAALEALGGHDFDVLVTELALVDMGGLTLIERVRGLKPDVGVVVFTARGTMDTAVSAMRAGAQDFLNKPLDGDALVLAVTRAAEQRRLACEVRRLRADAVSPPEGILAGESTTMKRILELVSRVGESDASVLVHGETGTGKELVARAIHAASARRAAPFIAINCAAMPAGLLESELFGHAKGAFTDAKTDRKGLFVQASGGTLLLDEIGEMPLQMQAKLLRALQERVVRPVGENVEVPFDARIVAATNRDLEHEVHEHRFREDLFYRINVVTIEVPPLRERGRDVLALAAQFLAKFGARSAKGTLGLSTEVAEKLLAYDWPGNVRELENSMESAAALARFDRITPEDLPRKIRDHRSVQQGDATATTGDDIVTLAELERRYIERVLRCVDGNKTRAASVLGLDRRTLYRKLERYQRATFDGENEPSYLP